MVAGGWEYWRIWEVIAKGREILSGVIQKLCDHLVSFRTLSSPQEVVCYCVLPDLLGGNGTGPLPPEDHSVTLF